MVLTGAYRCGKLRAHPPFPCQGGADGPFQCDPSIQSAIQKSPWVSPSYLHCAPTYDISSTSMYSPIWLHPRQRVDGLCKCVCGGWGGCVAWHYTCATGNRSCRSERARESEDVVASIRAETCLQLSSSQQGMDACFSNQEAGRDVCRRNSPCCPHSRWISGLEMA